MEDEKKIQSPDDARIDGTPEKEPQTSAAEEETPEPVTDPDSQSEEEKAEKEPFTMKQVFFDLLDMAEAVITSVFFVMMMFTFVFCVATVEGDSMLPTLSDQERLAVSRIDRNFKTGDILIIDSETAALFDADGNLVLHKGLGKRIVKRLIATGGQTVDIDFSPDAGIVYVDGQPLEENYVAAPTNRDNGAFIYPFTVPEGYIFVLGDNRYVSKDSRHPGVGLIPEEEVLGKVVLRLYPFSKFGRVDQTPQE